MSHSRRCNFCLESGVKRPGSPSWGRNCENVESPLGGGGGCVPQGLAFWDFPSACPLSRAVSSVNRGRGEWLEEQCYSRGNLILKGLLPGLSKEEDKDTLPSFGLGFWATSELWPTWAGAGSRVRGPHCPSHPQLGWG